MSEIRELNNGKFTAFTGEGQDAEQVYKFIPDTRLPPDPEFAPLGNFKYLFDTFEEALEALEEKERHMWGLAVKKVTKISRCCLCGYRRSHRRYKKYNKEAK